jgi:hypothetical protein
MTLPLIVICALYFCIHQLIKGVALVDLTFRACFVCCGCFMNFPLTRCLESANVFRTGAGKGIDAEEEEEEDEDEDDDV